MNQNNNDKIYPPVSHMVTHLGRLWHSCFLKRRASAGQDWSAPSGSTVKHTHTQIKWNTCKQTHHWKQFNNSCFSLKYYSPANVSTTWTESKETNKINSPHRQIKLICAAGHWWLRTSWPISNTIWTSKNKKASKQRSSETEQTSVKTLYSHSDFCFSIFVYQRLQTVKVTFTAVLLLLLSSQRPITPVWQNDRAFLLVSLRLSFVNELFHPLVINSFGGKNEQVSEGKRKGSRCHRYDRAR